MEQISDNKTGQPRFWQKIGLALTLCLISGWVQAAVTLNLKDAEISAVVEMVSKETGKNFVVDPRVKGKVTVISSHPMEKEQLYEVFLSLLDVHGFSAIESGDIIKIVPSANAKHIGGGNKKDAKGDAHVTRVVKIQNVSGAQLVPILRPLVPPQGHLAAHAQSNSLIISSQASTIDRLMSIIKRIDLPSSGEIEMVSLQNASATEVVRVLSSLQQQGRKADPQAAIPTLVADERTNSILLGGAPSERLRLRALITHLDSPTENIGNTHVIYLKYAKAKDMLTVLTGVAEGQAKAQGGKGASKAPAAAKSNFQIQADESTNALVITASPEMFRSLRFVIQKLDIRRAQVLIEAVIAEVQMDKTAELGVQWIFDSRNSGDGPIGVSNFGGPGSSIMGLAAAAASGTASVPNMQGALFGLGRFSDTGMSFATLIRALDGSGASNVLSTPNIVTLDNQEAEIVVGQTVPFLTGSYTSTGGSNSASNPFQTIKRENVGLTLKVLPQINAGNSVKLDIEQKADSIAASAVNASDLITNTRSFKTSVIVDDGKMIVLGGLIKDELIESQQKVPFLGDIPLLGALFRHKNTTKLKTNLMVFIKPTVLRSSEDSVKVTNQKYSMIRQYQQQQGSGGVALMSGEVAPLLIEDEPGLRYQTVPEKTEKVDGFLESDISLIENEPGLRYQVVPEEVEKVDDFLKSGIFIDE
ncbi:General secretion pathway protein D [hydrothermal vent metagenome]|uniref:General secretion pathway protein D n=1 Tax=hydrothermal vent metagenome TaxID=652676 RepID=A0A3B0ZCW3_9ZZZZ